MLGRLRWNKKGGRGGFVGWTLDRQTLTSSETSVDGHFVVELEDGGETRRLKSVFQIRGVVLKVQLGSQSKVLASLLRQKNCTVLYCTVRCSFTASFQSTVGSALFA